MTIGSFTESEAEESYKVEQRNADSGYLFQYVRILDDEIFEVVV